MSVSRLKAIRVLRKLKKDSERLIPGFSVSMKLESRISHNYGMTVPNDDGLGVRSIVGIWDTLSSADGVNETDLAEAVLDILHERRHIYQFGSICRGLNNGDAYENAIAVGLKAQQHNRKFYTLTYYDQPSEIDATEYSYREALTVVKKFLPEDDAKKTLLNIANKRFEFSGKTFANTPKEYHDFDEFLEEIKIKKSLALSKKSEFYYSFEKTKDVLDEELRVGDPSVARVWNKADLVTEKNMVAAALNREIYPEDMAAFTQLEHIDWTMQDIDLSGHLPWEQKEAVANNNRERVNTSLVNDVGNELDHQLE